LRPQDAVLPSGRISAPAGDVATVGTNPMGIALSPDGHFALVVNADERSRLSPPPYERDVVAGYSLAVIDVRTMRITDVYHNAASGFFAGVVAVKEAAYPFKTVVFASDAVNRVVRVFDLDDAGTLTVHPEAIALPHDFLYPSTLVASPDGHTIYAVDNLGGHVVAIDVASLTLMHEAQVGYFPYGIVAGASHVLVTNAGLAAYNALSRPAGTPQFATPAGDPYRSSSLTSLPVLSGGDLGDATGDVRLDPMPDGSLTVGGAQPSAVVARKQGDYAYVALANVDRVAVLSLQGTPHVVDGIDLRLFVNAPYGTQPSAEILSSGGSRLFVALAGINAVAVLDLSDPAHVRRLGLIPTGAYPAALALSKDGHYLYVVASEGVDGWGTLQRVDLHRLPLMGATLSALRYVRTAHVARFNPIVPAIRSFKRSAAIQHVVYVSVGTQSYDAMLGDLRDRLGAAHGNGDPALAVDDQSRTPNLHALALAYGLADNFYADEADIDANRQVATAGVASLFTHRTLPVIASRRPLDGPAQDPENYTRAGYVFNAVARAGLDFRDYGELLELSGYRDGSSRGLGGSYSLDVPALAALGGSVDLNYPGWNPRIPDSERAQEFVRDLSLRPLPTFTYVWIPTAPGADGVGEADRALGMVVDALTHRPEWGSTAIFIVPDGTDGSNDHVNRARSLAIVVSPFAKRGYVGRSHLSTASVVKTEEELLGLEPLSLNDFLATDLADFFEATPDLDPYQAIR
jgi:DNA-binding beta-propeller fold protein YncE